MTTWEPTYDADDQIRDGAFVAEVTASWTRPGVRATTTG